MSPGSHSVNNPLVQLSI